MQVYDEHNLEETARAVITFNRFAKGYTLDQMKENILSVVKDYPNQTKGYVRTGGFVVTFFVQLGSTTPQVKFSIDSSTLVDYLDHGPAPKGD